jgi:site-specific DNA recombinase
MRLQSLDTGSGKRVGIWIRVSTEEQAQGESPEHHERRANFYAESKDWEVIEVYRLEGVSGKAVSDHPETKRMVADIKRGRIEALIFSKLARLARNTKELLEFADIFKAHGADLVSLQESIDTSTPAGRLFYTMIAAMAQWEREEIAERVAASVPIRAKMGKPLGGRAPYGYQWLDGTMVPDPNEAPIRRRIYELFLEHKRKKTVARLLNEAGYRPRQGKQWTDTTIDRILRDPSAKGVRRANYTKSTGDKAHWVMKPESEWVLTEVEAIVSEELWNACSHILTEQASKKKPVTKKPVHLFAGLAICQCGQKMHVPSNSPKYTCKNCRNKIPIEDLEAVFYEQLKCYFLSAEDVAKLVQDADTSLIEREELIRTMAKDRQKVKAEIERLFQLHEAGEIPTQGFGARYKPCQDRLEQLDEEIPKLEAELDYLRINLLSQDEIIHEAQDLYSRWPQLTADEKRQIVENITQDIYITKDSVTINLCYLPLASKNVALGQRNHAPAAAAPIRAANADAPPAKCNAT